MNPSSKIPSSCGPDPATLYPIKDYPQVAFLKNFITSPYILIGDYTYYSRGANPDEKIEDFEKKNVIRFTPEMNRLIIGRFCCISTNVKFLMSEGNHDPARISTYPLSAFGHGWEKAKTTSASKGDTIVGNDVWLGYNVTVMPGIHIGDGAVVGCGSLVTKDVEPYTIVGGNPARLIRKRFDDVTIQKLLQIRWWDWDIQKITRNVHLLVQGDVDQLLHCT